MYAWMRISFKRAKKRRRKKGFCCHFNRKPPTFFYLFYFLWVYAIAVSKRVLKWCEFVFLGWQILQQRNQITFANFSNQLFQKILQKLIQKYLIKCNFFHPIWCVCWSLKLSTCVVDSKRRGKNLLRYWRWRNTKNFRLRSFRFFLFLSFPLLLSLKYTTPVLGCKRQRRAMCEKHQMEQAIKWLSNSPQVPPRRSDRSKQTAD